MKMYLPLVLIIALIFSGCVANEKPKTEKKPVEESVEKLMNKTAYKHSGEIKLSPEDKPVIVIETGLGNIEVELRPDKAPLTCENFANLVNDGYYDGLTFHRVIPNFMIQGGCPLGTGTGGPGYTVPAEITDLKHTLGALACARQSDQVNPKKASSGSQFYITDTETPHLDGQYTVFGYTVKGIEVVKQIAKVQTGRGNKPVETIYMKKVYIKK